MFVKASNRTLLVCLALLLITGALYAPALFFTFVNYDDPAYIVHNDFVNHGFTVAGLKWAFQAGYAANWHPLTWLSHMLDGELFGLNPSGHHATSILLHMFNSVLVFLVFKRLTGVFWRSGVVAALFAWHPIHVESTAWISERKDVLCAFFFLLTLWFYAGYAQALERKKKRRSYFLALFCFVLALESKPMAVTLPGVLLLLDFWPLSRTCLFDSQEKEASIPYAKMLMEKIPFFLLAMGCCGLTIVAQNRGHTMASLDFVPLSVRLMCVVMAYFDYLKKMIWPFDLAAIYPRAIWSFDAQMIVVIIFLAVVSFTAVRQRKVRPYWLVGWLWYLGMLIPVIGFVSIGAIAMADRYTYMPLLGIFMIICWELWENSVAWRYRGAVLGCLAGVVLAACLVLTSVQLRYWQNSTTLMTHAIAVTKNNYLALANYAVILKDEQKLEQALQVCETSMRIAPTYAWNHIFKADLLLQMGKLDAATEAAQVALRVDPNSPGPYVILGQILLQKNEPAKAAEELAEGLKMRGPPPLLELLLGKALVQQGKLAEAVPHLAASLQHDDQATETHYYYAVALSGLNRMEEAIQEYKRALALEPDNPTLLNDLAWILATDPRPALRDGRTAVQLAERACERTEHKVATMIGTLAAALAEAGRFDDAVKAAQKAHDVAVAQGDTERAARNLELQKIFLAKKPYHQEAP